MKSSNPPQTEESGIGNDNYYAASTVSPNANHQVQRVHLFTVDRTAKPVPNAAQTLEDQQFDGSRDPTMIYSMSCTHLAQRHMCFCLTIQRV
jgi:hypothetical protein